MFKSLLLVCRYIFRVSKSSSCIKVIRSQGQGHSCDFDLANVCPVQALNFECHDLECAFLVFLISRYMFAISRSVSYIKVIRSRSRSQERECLCLVRGWSAFV